MLKALLAALVIAVSYSSSTWSQEPVIPNFWDQQERFIKPDTSKLRRLRFLTTTDFPPFNFIDKKGRLAGFHVDLARAICRELDLEKFCQIQALPFNELEAALNKGDGEGILAGLAISAATREKFDFTRVYFRLPARFLTRRDSSLQRPVIEYLRGKKIGVVTATAHEAYAKNFFSSAEIKLFADEAKAVEAVKNKEIEAVFSDALSLSFFLHEGNAGNCCKFTGGAFLSAEYFGHGLAIATSPQNKQMTEALNFALRSINEKGLFAELYLRYFPISLY